MAPGRALASCALAAAALAAAELGRLALAQEEAATACSGAAEGQCSPEARLADDEEVAALLQTKHDASWQPRFSSYDGASQEQPRISSYDGARKKPPSRKASFEEVPVEVDTEPQVVNVTGYHLKADVEGVGLIKLVAIRQKAGNILSCTFNDLPSIIFNRAKFGDLDGSIFWPSPQAAWGGWPPIPEIEPLTTEQDPLGPEKNWYDVSHDEASLMLTSQPNLEYNVKVSKQVSLDVSKGGFLVDYNIYNLGDAPVKWAGWEVNRVHPGGLTFFPTGGPESCGNWKCLKLEYDGGATWFQHTGKEEQGKLYTTTAKPPAGTKTWLAHTDGVSVLVKCWEWVCEECHAPGEGSVEIYDGVDYVEVEPQGPYSTVEPGDMPLRWNVAWYVRPVPAGSTAAVGDQGLLRLAKDLCM